MTTTTPPATGSDRLPGMLITLDGPGGVGKSTTAQLVAKALDDRAIPVHTTTEPTRTSLGEHIRAGTDTYRGMALACLVAGDRHHHLAAEILPALHAGKVVVCDRYLPSSLVLQRIDGIEPDTVWRLNAGAYVPDVAVLLNADHPVIADRLRQRGAHSRFERQPGGSRAESDLYHRAAAELHAAGWPVMALDCTIRRRRDHRDDDRGPRHTQLPGAEPGMPELSLLTLNIANPSPERAERQLGWLAARNEDVLVLTETKDSAGCRLLADAFSGAGYHVSYSKPENGDYGVMIASRVQASTNDFGDRVGYLPSRAAAVTLPTPNGPIQVIGAYVPSRDASVEKTERKRKWLAACNAALATRNPSQATVFLGDLNVLEPDHQPRYKFFAPFEYGFYRQLTDDCGLIEAFRALHPEKIEHSWVGRTGDSYRYDHVHCTADLAATLVSCDYLHQARVDRLSDHSALSVRLAIEPSAPLITSAPATAGAPPTLF